MSDFQIKVDDRQLQKYFQRIMNKVKHPQPLLGQLGQVMYEAVMDNFEANGRPKWKELSSATKEQRRKKGYTGPQILRREGNLIRSITRPKIEGRSVSIATNLQYAAIHHFGGTINHPGGTKYGFYKGGGFGWKKKSNPKYVGKTKPHKIRIPARPFMMLTKIDIKDMIETIKEYVDDPRFPD